MNIIRAKRINLEERINTVATLVQKSIQDFQKHMQKYTTDITGRIKRATQVTREYGFVRKPELWHQYGMLFNHHGQVISGLKNMDLFLSIDLLKVEDIATCPTAVSQMSQLGSSTQNKQKSACVLLSIRIWEKQLRTYDRTKFQHE